MDGIAKSATSIPKTSLQSLVTIHHTHNLQACLHGWPPLTQRGFSETPLQTKPKATPKKRRRVDHVGTLHPHLVGALKTRYMVTGPGKPLYTFRSTGRLEVWLGKQNDRQFLELFGSFGIRGRSFDPYTCLSRNPG